MTRLRNTYLDVCFYTMSVHKNYFKKENIGQSLFNLLSAKPIKWSNTLKKFVDNLSKNCLSVFDHFVGLALKGLKKYLKFQNFNKILYCGMTRFRNVKLGVFKQYQNKETI